jgi:hypothetical protein
MIIKKCKKCNKNFEIKYPCYNQIYCGNRKLKKGCSWENYKEERRKERRLYKQRYPEINKEYKKKYPEIAKKTREKWNKNNPEKVKVQQQLNDEIKKGKIKRKPCEICGNPKSHGHHDDYSKPLEVIWLCGFHHYHYHNK